MDKIKDTYINDKIPVNPTICGTRYKMHVNADIEPYYRNAAKFINDAIETCKQKSPAKQKPDGELYTNFDYLVELSLGWFAALKKEEVENKENLDNIFTTLRENNFNIKEAIK
jgi:cell division protein ZapA (FtsZ GTPase activity inhibitor)